MSLENLLNNIYGGQLDETARANLMAEMGQRGMMTPPSASERTRMMQQYSRENPVQPRSLREIVDIVEPEEGRASSTDYILRMLEGDTKPESEKRGVSEPSAREVGTAPVDRLGVETLLSGEAPKMGGRRTSEQMTRTREAQARNVAQSAAPIPREKPEPPKKPGILERFFNKLDEDEDFARSMALFGFSLAGGEGNGLFRDAAAAAKTSMQYYDQLKGAKSKKAQAAIDNAYKEALTKKALADATGQTEGPVGRTFNDYMKILKSTYPDMSEAEARRQAIQLSTGAKTNPAQMQARFLEMAGKIIEKDDRMIMELSKQGPDAIVNKQMEIARTLMNAVGGPQSEATPVMSFSLEDLGMATQ